MITNLVVSEVKSLSHWNLGSDGLFKDVHGM